MARLIKDNRKQLSDDEFIEMKISEVPTSALFPQGIKYSLSYVKGGNCILRYDNEMTKGHHMHFLDKEKKIEFTDVDALIEKFEAHIERLRRRG